MKRSTFSFPSSDGKTTLQARVWEPETPPKALIQIAHGITEHMGRYEEFARYFTDRGYVVVGHDHIGHGASLATAGAIPMYFGPKGSWNFVVEDVRQCGVLCRQRYPGLKVCLLGFSLGSFAVRCLLGRDPDAADLAVWAGSGWTTPAERFAAQAVVRLEERRFGDTKETPLLHKLTADNYNKQFRPCRTDLDWLCANPQALDSALADPLFGRGFTVGSFRELLAGMRESCSPSNLDALSKGLPILLLSGQDDPVGTSGKGVETIRKQLLAHGLADVQIRLFPGMRHDLFRETDCAAVFRHLEAWLDTRL